MSKNKVNTNRIHLLYEALVKRHPSLEAIYYAILNEGLKAFNLSLGIISQVEDDRYTLLAVSPINKEISPSMIFELKNTYCQWVKVNSALTRMLGYSEDYLLSINFQHITHPDDLTTDL